MADAHHDAARSRPAAPWRSRTPRRRAAPRSTTSRPVFSWPSVWTTMRPRRSFSTSTCCVSASPSSQGMPACLMARERRRAGAAVVAGDQHDVGVRLGDAGRDRPDARLGDELDARCAPADSRSSDRRSAAPDPRSNRCRGAAAARSARRPASSSRTFAIHGIDLVAGQLPALAGLGALRHLDLQLVGVDQVLAGHAEAARGHLLDRAAPRVAVGHPACSAPDPRRPRRCSTCRRCGSSRWRASRAPPG